MLSARFPDGNRLLVAEGEHGNVKTSFGRRICRGQFSADDWDTPGWRRLSAGRAAKARSSIQGAHRADLQGFAARQDSPDESAGWSAERPRDPDRRRGLRRLEHLRGTDCDAQPRQAGEHGAALHAVPHHGAVLTHARGAADRTQPPFCKHGCRHGDGNGVSRLHRPDSQERCGGFRDPAAERLQHRLDRQEPQRPRLGDDHLRPIRQVAGPAGLRPFLWLCRRRGEPVGAGPVSGPPPGGDGNPEGNGRALHAQ